MLLGAQQNFEDLIIKILAEQGQITVPIIQNTLTTKYEKNISNQGIYRIIKKLTLDGIVLKQKNNYSLRIPWILDLSMLIQRMEDTYFEDKYLQHLIPRTDKEKHIWYFKDLLDLNTFWYHILLALVEKSTKKIFLNYSPHDWYGIVQSKQEIQFVKVFLSKIKAEYPIIGQRTFLDKYISQGWDKIKKEHYYLANKDEYILKNHQKHINIIEDFVLTISFTPEFNKQIDQLFCDKIKSEKDVRLDNILPLLKKKTKIKMVLQKHHKLAKYYHQRFIQVFGPIK